MDQVYELEMQVRDYECDIQGIVNNAVYQNYLEHCRHQFLQEVGLNFAQLHNEGIDAVVIRVEMDYKQSLRPDDRFTVKLTMHKEGNVRFVFNQDIIKKADGKPAIKAKVFAVLTKNGRPIAPTIFEEALRLKGYRFE
ncbi:acyl-CoA thioesterase [uncultured Acetobacteroides sp.]|uniref:acyl-CoA thioesterase n=1 Tax=uncultured Acetobacteroides sp. TaxID=1760811 RepID=UPI0029F4E811|nr:acyl-CoA thioesterase [uncultured Acetobacteroides sp.]